jgi:hypothetical protein
MESGIKEGVLATRVARSASGFSPVVKRAPGRSPGMREYITVLVGACR